MIRFNGADGGSGGKRTEEAAEWRTTTMHLTADVQATIAALQRIFDRDYEAYRQTHHWQHLRAIMLEIAGRQCEQCGFRCYLQVHHRHYRTIGFETPKDLVVLCRLCHKAEHGLPTWGERHEEEPESVMADVRRFTAEAERERQLCQQRQIANARR